MKLLDPLYYIERRNHKFGGGKGGGGADASEMVKYGDKALALQEKIYEEGKDMAQPWYQTGTSAVNQLGKLMGLNGTSANQNPSTRQSMIDQYRGQFTTGSPTSASATQFVGPDGRIYGQSTGLTDYMKNNPNDAEFSKRVTPGTIYKNADLTKYGFNPLTTGGGQTTDTAGLNSYVDKLLADQGAQNESDPLFGTLAKSFSMEDFQTDPGYQFRLSEGQKALDRQLNARGKTYSPEAAKALMGYNQDMGSQEYNNSYNRFNIDQDNIFNRLATLSGFGQTASGQIANAGANYAAGGSDILTGQGNAITSAKLANNANSSSMFNTLLGAGAQLGSAYLRSDERLKTDIQYHDEKNGFKRYKFRYIDRAEKQYIGVMAQDVLKTNPEAVMMADNGFYMVNYDKLGLQMEVL